jgi:hypothetical protein
VTASFAIETSEPHAAMNPEASAASGVVVADGEVVDAARFECSKQAAEHGLDIRVADRAG